MLMFRYLEHALLELCKEILRTENHDWRSVLCNLQITVLLVGNEYGMADRYSLNGTR